MDLRFKLGTTLALLMAGAAAQAATITIPVAPGEGSISGTVVVTDLLAPDTGKVKVDIDVTSGDILGFFFNLNPNPAAGTSIGGSNKSPTNFSMQVCYMSPAGYSCGTNANNMNGQGGSLGPYEWGVLFGAQGASNPVGNDISFTLSGLLNNNPVALSAAQFVGQKVGVRVQAIPPNGASAKLIGMCSPTGNCYENGGGPPQEVPEPATYMALGSGLAALAFLRRKRSR